MNEWNLICGGTLQEIVDQLHDIPSEYKDQKRFIADLLQEEITELYRQIRVRELALKNAAICMVTEFGAMQDWTDDQTVEYYIKIYLDEAQGCK